MAKFFAVTIIIIAIASAIPIVMHTWPTPQDISTHGALIDEQTRKPWRRPASRSSPRKSFWPSSSGPPPATAKTQDQELSGGAKGLVIAAFLLVGTEALALGVFGAKAWADRLFHAAGPRTP